MTQLRFHGDFSLAFGLALAVIAGAACYWLYRRETSRSNIPSIHLLPWLRSIAVGLIVLMITGPTLEHRWREGEPGRLTVVIDDSASMQETDGQAFNRYQRAIQGLLNRENNLLPQMAEGHEVQVVRGSVGPGVELWSSTVERASPLPDLSSAWDIDQFQSSTALGSWLDQDRSSVVIVMSDGQVNQGTSWTDAAQRVPYGKRPIFTVGYGNATALPSLSIVHIEYPDRIFRRDSLTGKVIIRDSMPPGQRFLLQAWHGDKLAWEQPQTTDGSGQRTIGFHFPIEKWIAERDGSSSPEGNQSRIEHSAIPFALQFRIVEDEANDSTILDRRDIRLWASLHRSRVLLVDGRSRWESRYLKNLFDRDTFWELTHVLVEIDDLLGGQIRLPMGDQEDQFPNDRDSLMKYDLIILGEIPGEAIPEEQQQWLVDFVAESGGGMLIIDGQRQSWRDPELQLLASLLPVEHQTDVAPIPLQPSPFELTASGRNLAPFDIRQSEDASNATAWESLPPPHWFASVRARPGSEVLATLRRDGQPSAASSAESPIFVTRLFGAGRVFYSASDESWRWRYKVADAIHQRFWNQVARWIMRAPFVVESEFVSLDAGRMTYTASQAVELRCRLRKDDATPLKDAHVMAHIDGEGMPTRTINLEPDLDSPGVYRGTAINLPSGDYTVSVSASGVPQEALAVTTQFTVIDEDSIETRETTLDADSLRRVADLTGGRFLTEEELPELIQWLTPLRRGRIVESETLLWQSYYWFVPVVLLLALEWWIRKRAGLL